MRRCSILFSRALSKVHSAYLVYWFPPCPALYHTISKPTNPSHQFFYRFLTHIKRAPPHPKRTRKPVVPPLLAEDQLTNHVIAFICYNATLLQRVGGISPKPTNKCVRFGGAQKSIHLSNTLVLTNHQLSSVL